MKPEDRIILAVDVPDHDGAMDIVNRFKDQIGMFKVGNELFTSAGPAIVQEITRLGKNVFLDLKYHDIPNTVSRSARAAVKLNVYMFNVHTLGGLEMMEQAARELVKASLRANTPRPKILGVTLLTSINQTVLTNELGIAHRIRTQVKHLAKMAAQARLDGVVASAQDVEMIRQHLGPDFLIVTPGIRPSWAPPDDQKRTMTPREAVRKGADYIVIGRAILSHPDPEKALRRIREELAGA